MLCGIASLVVLAIAPAAQAAQRFAAPAGTGGECTQAKPCELSSAVGGASAGDEVIVTTGTYTVKGSIFFPPATNVQVHGDLSGPMPRINAAFPGPVFFMNRTGDSLSYLEIENDADGGAGALCYNSKLERVRVNVVGSSGVGAAEEIDCAIRNSLFHVAGTGAVGIRAFGRTPSPSSASARNVTAIVSGSGSKGALATWEEPVPGSFSLELENSIVRGAETDLKAFGNGKGTANIAVDHSNYVTVLEEGGAKVIAGAGNQTTPPLFVDKENSDFREAAGSPTIDAGIAGELGPLDLAGNTRIQGAAPDIGAYEATPAPALPAAQLQSLKVAPSSFRAAKSGGAVVSAKGKKAKGPIGTKVTYSLSGAGTVDFTVEQLTTGRKAGGRCVKQTPANKGKKKCDLAKKLKGGFSATGATGQNGFKFSGRIGKKALKEGRYRLVGSAGGVIKRASFTILK
jgi:hypothetical protein